MSIQNTSENKRVMDRPDMQRLIDALKAEGYTVIGPVERSGAVVYRPIERIDEMPIGRVDEQSGAHYRLKEGDGRSLFSYVVGPESWKQFLHPPVIRLFSAEKRENGIDIIPEQPDTKKRAFFGARACELHAIAVQDRVFLEGNHVDPGYRQRRENTFIVAVNCARAGNTCFCVSMNTGPAAKSGFDLALTEIAEEDRHLFVVNIGSEAGARIMETIPHSPADNGVCEEAERIVDHTAATMGRSMDTTGIKDLLYNNLEHPRWDNVAERCLACGNCTMVCPTCFCATVEDVTDLTGEKAERWRKWDSCFTTDFSYIHGGSVRTSHKARYRQWMTHKLATWIDQFGTSGCVGCGRCIAWCPVGIDITEEVAAIRSRPPDTPDAPGEENGHEH